jgi:hypothetical protein
MEEAVFAIPGFLEKGHTKETMMRPALTALGYGFVESLGGWPSYGLVRILWRGPWWEEGLIARYRQSHWVAYVEEEDGGWVFDINAVREGWIPIKEWEAVCVPWILERFVPGAAGGWENWERFEVFPQGQAGVGVKPGR